LADTLSGKGLSTINTFSWLGGLGVMHQTVVPEPGRGPWFDSQLWYGFSYSHVRFIVLLPLCFLSKKTAISWQRPLTNLM